MHHTARHARHAPPACPLSARAFALQDLFEAIARGDYPEWQLCIQTMSPADEERFDFDPLDVTKVWPEDLFPLQPVGRMVRRAPCGFFFFFFFFPPATA